MTDQPYNNDALLIQQDVTINRVVALLREAGLPCRPDDDEINIIGPNTPFWMRIRPEQLLIEFFIEVELRNLRSRGNETANRLNDMSHVQWLFFKASHQRPPFLVARVCMSYEGGVVAAQMIRYAREFPSMVYTLVKAIGADIISLVPKTNALIH